MGYTLVVWLAYPIVWVLASSTHNLSVNGEVIAYAVLDVLSKAVFGLWLLTQHRAVGEPVEVGGYWANGLGAGEGFLRVGQDDA